MTLQNRVTPFGEIVAIAQRGLFTGNRGIIHDPKTKTLLRKRWASKAWLICSCAYRGIRRDPMATNSWTELFFLDEVTALAAGHRPCCLCRPQAAQVFKEAWARSKGVTILPIADMDADLHIERLEGRSKKMHRLAGSPTSLPDGTSFAADGKAYLLSEGRPFIWTTRGYRAASITRLRIDGTLTPPSTIGALKAGYRPVFHPTIGDE
jgi:hypothetical protein